MYIFSFPQDIDRNQKISAMNGMQFFLVDVIAHILHHLKCQLLTLLRDFLVPVDVLRKRKYVHTYTAVLQCVLTKFLTLCVYVH